MKSKKKVRNKKFNPVKKQATEARGFFHNKFIGFVTGTGDKAPVRLLNYSGEIIKMSLSNSIKISELRYKWSVYLSVFGIDSNGKHYSKSESCHFKELKTQAELVDCLNEKHQELIKNFNPNHITGAGWLANVSNRELEEKQAFSLFESLGACFEKQTQEQNELNLMRQYMSAID